MQVLTWRDLKKGNVESTLDQIEPDLRGTVGATVLIYISCHSRTVFGCPEFLPADAGRWGEGVPIFRMVRRLSSIDCCSNLRIHVMLNGCMEIPGGLEHLFWLCKHGRDPPVRLSDGYFLLKKSEAQAWLLFACHPGRRVPGDFYRSHSVISWTWLDPRSELAGWKPLSTCLIFWSGDKKTGGVFTKKILSVLHGKLGPEDSQIERYYDELSNALRDRGEARYKWFRGCLREESWNRLACITASLNDMFGFSIWKLQDVNQSLLSLSPGWCEISSLLDDNWQCGWSKPARRDIPTPFTRELWQRLPMYGNTFLLKLHGVKRYACLSSEEF